MRFLKILFESFLKHCSHIRKSNTPKIKIYWTELQHIAFIKAAGFEHFMVMTLPPFKKIPFTSRLFLFKYKFLGFLLLHVVFFALYHFAIILPLNLIIMIYFDLTEIVWKPDERHTINVNVNVVSFLFDICNFCQNFYLLC